VIAKSAGWLCREDEAAAKAPAPKASAKPAEKAAN
jgi:hypothetical protein